MNKEIDKDMNYKIEDSRYRGKALKDMTRQELYKAIEAMDGLYKSALRERFEAEKETLDVMYKMARKNWFQRLFKI